MPYAQVNRVIHGRGEKKKHIPLQEPVKRPKEIQLISEIQYSPCLQENKRYYPGENTSGRKWPREKRKKIVHQRIKRHIYRPKCHRGKESTLYSIIQIDPNIKVAHLVMTEMGTSCCDPEWTQKAVKACIPVNKIWSWSIDRSVSRSIERNTLYIWGGLYTRNDLENLQGPIDRETSSHTRIQGYKPNCWVPSSIPRKRICIMKVRIS